MISGSMSLKGFEYLLITHGVNCYNRLHGYTCRDELIETREKQIKRYLKDASINGSFVVLDDLNLRMSKNHFVRTDYSVGLTLKDVDKVIMLFEKQENENYNTCRSTGNSK